MAAAKKLYRSNDSVIAGVCAGVAERLDVDSAVVRILSVLVLVATGGLAAIVYLIFWLILPRQAVVSSDTIPASASAEGYQYQHQYQTQASYGAPTQSYAHQEQEAGVSEGPSGWAKLGVAVGLVFLIIGIAGLISSVIDGVHWWQLWPGAIILAGFLSAFVSSPRVSLAWRISRCISLLAIGTMLLSCSTGVLAWASISLALSQLWPAIFILLGFAIVGAALHNDVFAPVFTLCVVLVCVAIMTIYAIPGPLNAVAFDAPLMSERLLDINPWK